MSEREERENGTENILEDITTENLVKDSNIQVQDVMQLQVRESRAKAQHDKFLKVKDK